MNLSENEIVTLRCLMDGEQHNDGPKTGISKSQFYAAVKSLKEKGYVGAALYECGGDCTAWINTDGIAAYEDYMREDKRQMRKILEQVDLSYDDYDNMLYTRENGSLKNIHGLDDFEFQKVWQSLMQRGFMKLKEDSTDIILTKDGIDKLEEIEDILYDDNTPIAVQQQVQTITKVEVVPSSIYIKDGKVSDFIRVLRAMQEDGIFVDKDGNKIPLDSLMKESATTYNCPSLDNYSALQNRAFSSNNKNTVLDVFERMKSSAEAFYEEKRSRKIK